MPRTGQPAIRHVAAVERAVAVLDALAESGADLGTNEIARRTGINASSVSRLLATLAVRDLVQHVPETGRYRLGLRLLQLGNAALARLDLREVARPHMAALAEATGETATLSVPGEWEAVTVDFVQSPSSVQSIARVGRPSVAHATAVGKVFLAYGGKLPDGPLTAYTDRTLTDAARLTEEVARVAARGWAEAVGEREADLNAIAAPILGPHGELLAILGVQGPAGRFNRRALRAALPALLESAGRLSARAPE
jgi:DNA-binding IclR family transcriptional regulator